jgi:hypothetical protein
MKKQKKKSKAIKDLFLDRPTSHGGWPDGHGGSYTDPNTPVNQQIANYLKAMGLVDDTNPRARLAENTIRRLIRSSLKESLSNYPPGMTDQDLDDYFGGPDLPSENADIEDIIEEIEETLEEYAEDLGYLQQYPHAQALRMTYKSDTQFFDEIYDEQILSR